MANITVNTSIVLPPDLVWSDEVAWSRVEKRETLSVTGTSIIQSGTKQAGRRITLESGQDYACLERSVLLALLALRDTDQQSIPLVLGDGRTFDVQFAPSDSASIEATPLQPGKNPAATDLYRVKLRFMEN